MFVMATSSHAETGDGGAAGIMATHTPVSSPATVSRTRKAISARPKMSDKAKLTRVAVERRVIRAAQKPAKPHVTARSSAPKLDKTAGVVRTAQKAAKLRVVTARSSGPKLDKAGVIIQAAQSPAKPRVETAHSSAPKLDKTGSVEATEHRIVIQVTQNDPALMNMALNNAQNLVTYYDDKAEKVQVEFVAYGPGLHMVRSDTSPVKERLSVFALKNPNVIFSGCGNTKSAHSKQENKEISLVAEARTVPTGIARIVELQEQGWTYVRP